MQSLEELAVWSGFMGFGNSASQGQPTQKASQLKLTTP
jgi:hypothetical protein